jgi:hypothetical protein
MATLNLTDEQIKARGLDALRRELGPGGLIRFMKQFELGRGDYSKERHRSLRGKSVANLAREIRKRRAAGR